MRDPGKIALQMLDNIETWLKEIAWANRMYNKIPRRFDTTTGELMVAEHPEISTIHCSSRALAKIKKLRRLL